MDRRGVVIGVVIPWLGAIVVSGFGIGGPWVGFYALVAVFVLTLAEIVTPIEYRFRKWLGPKLPYEVRSPVVRKTLRVVIPEPSAPLGFLDFQLAAERAMDQLIKIVGELRRDMERLTRLTGEYSPRSIAAQRASTQVQVNLSREYAGKLERQLLGFAGREAALREAGRQLSENMLQRIRLFPPEADLSSFRRYVELVRTPTMGARDSMAILRKETAKIRGLLVQQAVNAATDRLLRVLDGIMEDYGVIIQFGDDALAELDRRAERP